MATATKVAIESLTDQHVQTGAMMGGFFQDGVIAAMRTLKFNQSDIMCTRLYKSFTNIQKGKIMVFFGVTLWADVLKILKRIKKMKNIDKSCCTNFRQNSRKTLTTCSTQSTGQRIS